MHLNRKNNQSVIFRYLVLCYSLPHILCNITFSMVLFVRFILSWVVLFQRSSAVLIFLFGLLFDLHSLLALFAVYLIVQSSFQFFNSVLLVSFEDS